MTENPDFQVCCNWPFSPCSGGSSAMCKRVLAMFGVSNRLYTTSKTFLVTSRVFWLTQETRQRRQTSVWDLFLCPFRVLGHVDDVCNVKNKSGILVKMARNDLLLTLRRFKPLYARKPLWFNTCWPSVHRPNDVLHYHRQNWSMLTLSAMCQKNSFGAEPLR